MEKRCYTTSEAMAYLGVRRRTFDTVFKPLLAGKGVRVGTSVVYEKLDLDQAWETYKEQQGSARAVSPAGALKWHDQQSNAASTGVRTVPGKSMPNTGVSAFESVVSRITGRRKTS